MSVISGAWPSVFVADGNHYFNRPGPRIVESLEILAEILHPELFAARYEDFGSLSLHECRIGPT